jgi:hypothetical protein
MNTKQPIFKEVDEPLQADEWLNTIEQKFSLLRVTKGMKASYAGHQLQGAVGIWWNHHKKTFPADVEVVWDQDCFPGSLYSSWYYRNQAH